MFSYTVEGYLYKIVMEQNCLILFYVHKGYLSIWLYSIAALNRKVFREEREEGRGFLVQS